MTKRELKRFRKEMKDIYKLATEELLRIYKEEAQSKRVEQKLFYDDLSGRYFMSTPARIESAKRWCDIQMCIKENTVTLNDFYEILGLPKLSMGNMIVFNDSIVYEIECIERLNGDTFLSLMFPGYKYKG